MGDDNLSDEQHRRGLEFVRRQGSEPYRWGSIGPNTVGLGEWARALRESLRHVALPPGVGAWSTAALWDREPTEPPPREPVNYGDGYAVVPAQRFTVTQLIDWMTAEGIPHSAELDTDYVGDLTLTWQAE